MRVALLIDSLATAGGVEAYLRDLARFLSQAGDRVTLFSAVSRPAPEWEMRQVPSTGLGRGARLRAFARAVEGLLAQNPFDVTLAVRHCLGADIYQPHGGVVGPAWRARHAARTGAPARWLGRLTRPLSRRLRAMEDLERRLVAGCRYAVAISDKVARELEETYAVPREKLRRLPLGVDLERFTPGGPRVELRHEHGLQDGDPLLLFAGFNPRLKGWETALRVLQAVGPRAHLIVCGPAANELSWPLPLRHLRPRVHVMGRVDGLETIYRAVDLLLHPTFYDPCSLVVLEALACGCPVVTTRCNGAAEVGGEALRGSCLPQDVNGLAEDVMELLQKRDRVRGAARDSVIGRSRDRHFEQLRGLLEDCSTARCSPRQGS